MASISKTAVIAALKSRTPENKQGAIVLRKTHNSRLQQSAGHGMKPPHDQRLSRLMQNMHNQNLATLWCKQIHR
jgi:hypothetical protein